jgi:hypothetical protein
MKLTIHFHLVPILRKGGIIPPLPPYAFKTRYFVKHKESRARGSIPSGCLGFIPREVQMRFVVDILTLRQIFSKHFRFPCQFSSHKVLHLVQLPISGPSEKGLCLTLYFSTILSHIHTLCVKWYTLSSLYCEGLIYTSLMPLYCML